MEIWLNQNLSVDEIDCVSKGCTLHDDLTWVGWLVQDGAQNALWVAPINQETRQIDIENKRQVSTNALQFRFTENKIVYSVIIEYAVLALGARSDLPSWMKTFKRRQIQKPTNSKANAK